MNLKQSISPETANWQRMVWAYDRWQYEPAKYSFGKRDVRNFLRTYEGAHAVIGDTDRYVHYIANGIKFKYPSCCIKNFADLTFQGVAPAVYYDMIGRGNNRLLDYIQCDKCFYARL